MRTSCATTSPRCSRCALSRPEAILAFDTSAAHCAAALLSGGKVILRDEAMDKGQAERLVPMLEDVLQEAGMGWQDLTAIAVGTGPGNFTGVRIAVAAARGLALGLGVPAIGVSRLEALAHRQPRPVIVIEDARRGEVYVQRFTLQGAGPAQVVPAAAASETRGATTGNAAPGGLAPALPLAQAMAEIGLARVRSGQAVQRPAPFYLRAADAAPSSDPPPVILP